jgi:uncharacterized protein
MTDLIDDWRKKRENYKKENLKYVKKLIQHKGKALDNFASELHEEVFKKIDCLNCAGCCSGLPAMVNKTDSLRISKKLGIKVSEFEQEYLQEDEDGDKVYKQSPCIFLLEDKKCSIYEFRPKACREYPHTSKDFSKNLRYHGTNTMHCPATFHILARIKKSLPI